MDFTFVSSKGKVFQCKIKVSPCRHPGCVRTTSLGDVCAVHAKRDFGIVLWHNEIPDGGIGLFAARDIAKGVEVTPPYTGELLTPQEMEERYDGDFAPYAVRLSHDLFVDAACERSWPAMINHNPRKANVRFVVSHANRTIRIVSTKTIKAGAELFLNYGPDYSRRMRQQNGPRFSTTRSA